MEDHIVADFKLSRHSRKPDISSVRKEKQINKEAHSTSGKYAFRLSGFTTPTYKEGGLLITDEGFLRKVFKKIVTAENKPYFCEYLTRFAETLRKVNRKYYNTSLFLAKGKNRSEIKWIDFHYWCTFMIIQMIIARLMIQTWWKESKISENSFPKSTHQFPSDFMLVYNLKMLIEKFNKQLVLFH